MSDVSIRRRTQQTEAGLVWHLSAWREGAVSPSGTLEVRPGIGLLEPRYWFHAGLVTYRAPELGIVRQLRTLTLCSDLAGSTALSAPSGSRSTLRLLLQAALLWLACDGIHAPLIAEPKPVAGALAADASPPAFFKAVGAHFLPEADFALVGDSLEWPAHLTGLLPRHPLFVDLLPEPARLALDALDGAGTAWLEVLRQEGLAPGRCVTLVEGRRVFEGSALGSVSLREAASRQVVTRAVAAPVEADADPPAHVLVLDPDGSECRLRRGICGPTHVCLDDAGASTGTVTQAWCVPARLLPEGS